MPFPLPLSNGGLLKYRFPSNFCFYMEVTLGRVALSEDEMISEMELGKWVQKRLYGMQLAEADGWCWAAWLSTKLIKNIEECFRRLDRTRIHILRG